MKNKIDWNDLHAVRNEATRMRNENPELEPFLVAKNTRDGSYEIISGEYKYLNPHPIVWQTGQRRGHPRINIDSIYDFNCVVSEMVDEFLEDFPERGLTEVISKEHSFIPDGVAYMYTVRGMQLYETYERRLQKVAEKNFPDTFDGFKLDCTNMITD